VTDHTAILVHLNNGTDIRLAFDSEEWEALFRDAFTKNEPIS
jgi:hypothetical protein